MCSSVHNSVHRSNHHPRTSQQPHIPPSLQSKQQPHFHPNTSSHIPDLGKLRASSSIRSRQQHRQSSLAASYEYDMGYSAEKGYKRSHTSSLKASEDKITKRLLKDMGLKKLPDILHVSFGPNCSMSCCPSLYGGYQMSLYAIEQKIIRFVSSLPVVPKIIILQLFQTKTSLKVFLWPWPCLLYTSPSPRDATLSRMPSSA